VVSTDLKIDNLGEVGTSPSLMIFLRPERLGHKKASTVFMIYNEQAAI